MILDLFAGPGGWSEGLYRMGLADVGIEWDEAACATRAAAGHLTIRADVAAYPREVFRDRLTGMIASPPCQAFSRAGRRLGLDDVRGQLVYQVVEWAEELGPPWIACEQVPAVLPIWKAFADPLRDMGYSVWYGILNAVEYGVPQDRQRAILMAKLDGTLRSPPATHGYRNDEDDIFGASLLPVETMAAALGWQGAVGFARADDVGDSPDGYRVRDWRSADRPAQTVTEKARSWTRKLNTGRDWKEGGTREDAQVIDGEAPAPTLTGQSISWQWRDVELVPGSFADGRENGHRRTYDAESEAAPTLHFGNDSAGWRWRYKYKNADPDAPAPDWPLERPATTVVTRNLVPDPGQNTSSTNNATKTRNDGYRVETWEAGVLQSFPPAYPWQGNKTKQFQQIGNAIPPLLAEAILKELIQ